MWERISAISTLWHCVKKFCSKNFVKAAVNIISRNILEWLGCTVNFRHYQLSHYSDSVIRVINFSYFLTVSFIWQIFREIDLFFCDLKRWYHGNFEKERVNNFIHFYGVFFVILKHVSIMICIVLGSEYKIEMYIVHVRVTVIFVFLF